MGKQIKIVTSSSTGGDREPRSERERKSHYFPFEKEAHSFFFFQARQLPLHCKVTKQASKQANAVLLQFKRWRKKKRNCAFACGQVAILDIYGSLALLLLLSFFLSLSFFPFLSFCLSFFLSFPFLSLSLSIAFPIVCSMRAYSEAVSRYETGENFSIKHTPRKRKKEDFFLFC